MLDLPEETEKLIELIAKKTGKTPATVVHESVQVTATAAGISQSHRKLDREELIQKMRAISDRAAARPVLDSRDPNEIIGYDEFGLPN